MYPPNGALLRLSQPLYDIVAVGSGAVIRVEPSRVQTRPDSCGSSQYLGFVYMCAVSAELMR